MAKISSNLTSTPLIQVHNFKMLFGSKEVIKNLSFEVYKGEVFGLLGSNGSGKTTTIRALLGLFEPSSGQLLIDNQAFQPGNSQLKIGYLPEERGLYKKESVINIMRYFADLKGLSKNNAQTWISNFLQRVDLLDKAKVRLDKLSSGQQQKVQLGITIMGQPDLLILDEPTKGFDPVNRQLLLDIIDQERQRGATILMITHHMEEVERLCDRVLLLKDGQAKAYGRVEDIRDQAGQNRIQITFNGHLPSKSAPFKIISCHKTQAELLPKTGQSTNQILEYLLKQGLDIRHFSIERPSLNEIFVQVYDNKTKNNSKENPSV